jgi:3-hydroxy acid dehydrogenase/malonic semialdehyde reductase
MDVGHGTVRGSWTTVAWCAFSNLPLMKHLIALITGASSGIGEACAHAFAQAGYHTILWARRSDRLQTLADTLRSQYNVSVLTHTVDVRDRSQVEVTLGDLPAEWSNISVLINNAGLSRGLHPFHHGEHADWEEMIDTNLKGLIYVSRAVLPGMVERGSGTVINIASIAGLQPYPGGNVYSATKAAVKMLSDSWQIDLNGTGVRVTNIDPGLVETEFSDVRFRGDTDRAATVYKGYQPLTGADIADVALFAATRPAHVSIQDVLITPTAQATTTLVRKETL